MIMATATRAARLAAGGRRALIAGAIVGLVLLVGCPGPGPNPDPNSVDPNSPDPNSVDPNAVDPNAPPATTITLELVASGFVSPIALASPDDGTERLFVADQIGLIYAISPTAGALATPLLDLRTQLDVLATEDEERGLLGLALHPEFADNRLFYVCYNTPPSNDAPAGSATELRVSEFSVFEQFPSQADINSERVLLRTAKPQTNHNGGQIAFGPDGFLYIGIGDGGGADDGDAGHTAIIGNAQDTSNLLGAILRIDVDSGNPYGIPANNPLISDNDALDEIYAYGLRNPWRFSFDVTPGGRTRLFVGDVGQELFEEIDLVTRGGNYGWRIKEATSCFDPITPATPLVFCEDQGPDGSELRDPILEYGHTDGAGQAVGTAVIGGYGYRGVTVAKLHGAYVFGDYSTSADTPDGTIFAATEAEDGTWSFDELAIAGSVTGRLGRYVLGFGRDAAGELYVLTRASAALTGTTGAVHRITAAD